MIYGVTEKPALGTEGHSGGVPTSWQEVDAFHPWVAFLYLMRRFVQYFSVIC